MVATSAMVFATSCSNDEVIEQGAGDIATVSFAINTDGAVASRALSDGSGATRLFYQVYRVENGAYKVADEIKIKDGFHSGDNISLKLAKGQEYAVAFWAQSPVSPYVLTSGANGLEVDMNYDASENDIPKNNTENRDAFFNCAKLTVNGDESKTVTLKRPFAQVNVGASDYDVHHAQIVGSSVTFSNVATTLNLMDGSVSGETTVTFTNNRGELYSEGAVATPTQTLTVNGTNYTWLSMSYVLPTDAEASTTVSSRFEIEVADGENIILEDGLANMPIQRNYRTNIIGSVLTNNVDFKVEVDANFEKPDHNITNDANELKIAAAKGGEITLSGNITLDEALKIEKDLVINLNGYNITANNGEFQIANTIAALISAQNSATVTINGNGEINGVNGKTIAVEARGEGSKAIINGGTYVGESTAVYAINGGNVEINGGTFSLSGWSNDNYVLKDNTNSSIEVTGGKFYRFNPADNVAEGNGTTNFVKEGYVSTKISENPDVYMVTKVAATTTEALNAAIQNGGSIYVAANGLKITATNVENCEFYGYPVYVEGNTTFKNVTFNNATESLTGAPTPSAVYVTGNNADTKNISFEGCTFEEAVWDGIQVTNPNLESISFKNCVFVNNNKLTPNDFGVNTLNRRYIHLETKQEVGTRVEITGCSFTNVSLDYCPGSAVCIFGYKTENMTINNNIVNGAGANALTTDMIWISNGLTRNLWTVEQIKVAFVAK